MISSKKLDKESILYIGSKSILRLLVKQEIIYVKEPNGIININSGQSIQFTDLKMGELFELGYPYFLAANKDTFLFSTDYGACLMQA